MRIPSRSATLAISAFLLSVTCQAPARAAADDDVAADARCLVISMQVLLAGADDTVRHAAMLANVYYLGKLDGRAPGTDLENRLRAEIARMTPEQAGEEALRCGDTVNERTLAVSDLGSRLIARAQ